MMAVNHPSKFLASVLFMVATASAAHAKDGTQSGGGGDIFANHFAGIGNRIGNAFRRVCQGQSASAKACGHLTAFEAAVARSKVVPRNEVRGRDGVERDAGNNGVDLIELSTPRWKAFIAKPGTQESQVSLVAHEFMSLAGGDSYDRYDASNELIEHFRANAVDFAALAGKAPGLSAGTARSVEIVCSKGDKEYIRLLHAVDGITGTFLINLEHEHVPALAVSAKDVGGRMVYSGAYRTGRLISNRRFQHYSEGTFSLELNLTDNGASFLRSQTEMFSCKQGYFWGESCEKRSSVLDREEVACVLNGPRVK